MTVMELGALGEFLGVFALVATLIYLSTQVRHARHESEREVLQARTTGARELQLSVATSDGLLAALIKAEEAIGAAPLPFQAELISHGLDRQEAHRVYRWQLAQFRVFRTDYESATQEQRGSLEFPLRVNFSSGLGRLFWDTLPAGRQGTSPFSAQVNQLIAEADQETQQ